MTFFESWYRARTAIYLAAGWAVLLRVIVALTLDWPPLEEVVEVLAVSCAAVMVLTVLVCLAVGRRLPPPPPAVVHSPVTGRWLALNSPATKVPSHGVSAYGQSYAIDLVAEPPNRVRPEFGGAVARAHEEYPAMGQPVHSMIDGTVVRASHWRRDHRARSNMAAVIYMMIEGAVRELGGPGFILGNHLVVRGDDGTFAALAHLQRGSLLVSVGERVRAGQVLARCGNSGNSSEPHVHAQLMDRASTLWSLGLPMVFAGVEVGGVVADQLPGNGEHLCLAAAEVSSTGVTLPS